MGFPSSIRNVVWRFGENLGFRDRILGFATDFDLPDRISPIALDICDKRGLPDICFFKQLPYEKVGQVCGAYFFARTILQTG